MWLANWKLRPSEPISEHSSTCAPVSSSANQAAARSRSIIDIPSWNTAARIPSRSRSTCSSCSAVAALAQITSTF
ncbi:hypothetical protein [Xanthomonas phage vB_XooS_NR08]|nr:hypothetical protein [Xanthomonas phage vB_XooS_NR08]